MIDYYGTLNIKHNATKNEIKKAFKKEALKWHPDRNSSLNATAKMQIINEAYLILKDDEAKIRYDNQYQRFHSQSTWKNYSIDDDILNDWIRKAKNQAKEMVMFSIEDLVGMSKAATFVAWGKTKFAILILVIANIIFYCNI